MRIRTIKPEFFTHDGLFDAEKEFGLPLRIAYIGLWCAADREGRFRWEPRRLGAMILPYEMIDFSRVLDALVTRGFIQKHASEGVEFGVIPSFVKHQVINNRESESDLPEPTGESMIIGLPTRATRDNDACPTREVQVKAEGKGREGKGKGRNDATAVAEAIYRIYPRKEGKGKAIQAIVRALRSASAEILTDAVQAFALAKAGTDPQFIPHPASWFNARRWEDDRSTWVGRSPGGLFSPPSAPITYNPGDLDGIDLDAVSRL